MKIIFIIIDGLGDRPIPALGNKTPLEAAKTPNLDWLAKNGRCGLINPFCFSWQGYPHSDTAHLALFGYNPEIYYLGRGPYEATGIGFNLKKGDLALRANFGTVDKKLKVIDRRAGRIIETGSLVKTLSGIELEGVKFLVKKSFGHRATLILRGRNLSEKITNSDPHEVGVRVKKVVAKDKSKEAKFTAKILNRFLDKAHQVLKNHPLNKKRKLPANYLLVRGAGKFKKTPSFYQKYKLKACCIAGGGLYKGIAKILGMKLIKVKGATGLPTTNIKAKFQAIKKALGKHNFVFCHIKAADNLGEDGDFWGKKKFIEKIDRAFNILWVMKGIKDALIIVTGDHSTCSKLKRHCSEPVPILIYSPKFSKEKLRRASGNGKNKVGEPARQKFAAEAKLGRFGEKVCKKGELGKMKGLDLMPKILTLMRSRNFGQIRLK